MTPWTWQQALCRWPDCDNPAEGPGAAPGRSPAHCNRLGEDGDLHTAQNWWILSRGSASDPAPAPLLSGAPTPSADGYRQALDETRVMLDEAVRHVQQLIGQLAHLYEMENASGVRVARAEAALEAAVAAHDAAARRADSAEEERAVAERHRWAADAAAVEAVQTLQAAREQAPAAGRAAPGGEQLAPAHLALVRERLRPTGSAAHVGAAAPAAASTVTPVAPVAATGSVGPAAPAAPAAPAPPVGRPATGAVAEGRGVPGGRPVDRIPTIPAVPNTPTCPTVA
ncbi:hypothetical protein ACFWAR_02190 [Streptomyces sp. NPDC059917]|uniref:hypothetical protein n=1 Tax=Streptomyces sp. NPDC059917 TaxID=3347002 RepID=UPI003648F8FF